MLRIAVVEDDAACARQLQEYILRFGRERGETIETEVFTDGAQLVMDYRPVWDILLLDIEMPRLDGMTAAQTVRRTDPSVIIIFITNMAKYAIKGYEVDAMDFVLKPVSYFAFSVKLGKALGVLSSRVQHSLIVPSEGGIRKVPAEDVYYIEVADHRLHIHARDGDYTMLGTLREMEEQLEWLHFTRCNKCYLINLRHVVHLKGGTVTLSGGQELQVSRPRKKEFQMAVMNYYGGGGR